MESHLLLVWVHILLFVFWLGADVGVFVATALSRRSGMSSADRMLLLRVAMIVDILPRIAMALMLPVGLLLAQAFGLTVPSVLLPALWLLTLPWIASIIVAHSHGTAPLGAAILRGQRIAFAIGAALLLAWAVHLHATGSVPTWLALKIGLFGFVFLGAIAIDLTFAPVGRALGHPDLGQDAAADAAYAAAVNRCLVTVALLYAALLISSWLGVMKP